MVCRHKIQLEIPLPLLRMERTRPVMIQIHATEVRLAIKLIPTMEQTLPLEMEPTLLPKMALPLLLAMTLILVMEPTLHLKMEPTLVMTLIQTREPTLLPLEMEAHHPLVEHLHLQLERLLTQRITLLPNPQQLVEVPQAEDPLLQVRNPLTDLALLGVFDLNNKFELILIQ